MRLVLSVITASLAACLAAAAAAPLLAGLDHVPVVVAGLQNAMADMPRWALPSRPAVPMPSRWHGIRIEFTAGEG